LLAANCTLPGNFERVVHRLRRLLTIQGGAMKFKENAFFWLLTAGAVIALGLALDGGREPKGFFTAVRVCVCFASAYAAVKAYRGQRETWAWLLGANAALYNPFVLVHLARSTWNLVDLADVALLLSAAVVLRVRDESPAPLRGTADAMPARAAALVRVREHQTPSSTELALWMLLLALSLAGGFLGQYYALLEGTTQDLAHRNIVGTATLGLAFWAYVIARLRRWRRPGRIALGCFLSGVVMVLAAMAAAGYTNGSETRDVLASIGRFDPALEARLRAGHDSPGEQLSAMLPSSLRRALEQAPDAAVLAFSDERYALVEGSHANASTARCEAVFNGSDDFQLSEIEQRRMMQAMGDLFSAAAAAHKPAATEADRSAAAAALAGLYKKIDPTGLLGNQGKPDAIPLMEPCATYSQLMDELRAMSPKESAAIVRAMAGG